MNDRDTPGVRTDAASTGRDVRGLTTGVIGVGLGLFLGSAGVMKLLNVARFANYYAESGQPRWVFFGSGMIEVLAGVAMLLPQTRLYAAWSLLGMIFLICWKPWSVHEMFFLIPQIVAITLLIVLVWLLSSRRGASSLNG